MRVGGRVRGWRSRTITLILLVTLITLGGAAAFTYLAYVSASSALVIERDRELAYLSAARMREELGKYSDILEALARSPEIYEDNPVAQRQKLQASSQRLTVFDGGVVLLDNFGRVRASQPLRAEIMSADWSDRDYFTDLFLSKSAVLSNAVPDGPGGSSVIVMMVPVLNERQEFVGGLAGLFRLGESTVSSFYASIVRLRIGQTGTTYVADGNGQILFDSTSGKVGLPLDTLQLPLEFVRGQSGAGRVRDAEGRDIVAAYAPIPGTGWTLVTEDDWAILTASVRGYARMLLALLAAGIILPAIGVALLVREKNREMIAKERDLREDRVARLLHHALLPHRPPLVAGWSLAHHHRSARVVGGDFYDYFVLPDGRVMLTVGNVTGGGVSAALLMVSARMTLRGAALRRLPPAEGLACSNELLCPDVEPGTAITCTYVILDPATGKLQFSCAGEHGLIPVGIQGFAVDGQKGPALGECLEPQFTTSEHTLSPGESVLLFSRGALETRSERDEPFGRDRLRAAAAEAPQEAEACVEMLRDRLKAFESHGAVPTQDLTLVVIHRSGPLSSGREALANSRERLA